MQSYFYNDDPSCSDDERYDEDDSYLQNDDCNKHLFGAPFAFPSYDGNEDMM